MGDLNLGSCFDCFLMYLDMTIEENCRYILSPPLVEVGGTEFGGSGKQQKRCRCIQSLPVLDVPVSRTRRRNEYDEPLCFLRPAAKLEHRGFDLQASSDRNSLSFGTPTARFHFRLLQSC